MLLKIVLLAAAAAFVALIDCNPSLWLYAKLSPSLEAYQDKAVWITGASSGIGAELAVQLSHAGARLVLSARRASELELVKARCKVGSSVALLPLDVTASTATLDAAVTKALAAVGGGGLELLVLNAGRSQRQPAVDSDIQVTRDIMKLNFESTVELAMLVIQKDKWVQKEKGHIVVTSSVAGKLPVALSSSYAASKAALHGYFNSLRSEFRWLRVDVVCPGPVATPIALAAHSTPAGKVHLQNEKNDNKMSVERFALLMLSGVKGPHWLFYETWISQQPELLFTALGQYLPTFTTGLAKRLGPKRIEAFYNGQDIYKSSAWMGKKS
jgi:dehydrogenase/reductase SDR family protein 7